MGKTYKDERKRGYDTKESVWEKRKTERQAKELEQAVEGSTRSNSKRKVS